MKDTEMMRRLSNANDEKNDDFWIIMVYMLNNLFKLQYELCLLLHYHSNP